MSDTPELIKGVLVDGQIHKIDFNALANRPDISKMQSDIAGKQDKLTFDTEPRHGSKNPVESGGINDALDNFADEINASILSAFDALFIDTSAKASAYINRDDYTVFLPYTLSIYNEVFRSKHITSVYAPHCSIIGEQAFTNVYMMSSIYIPECKIIGMGAFYGCRDLSGILSIPECEEIGNHAFASSVIGYGGPKITSIYAPRCMYIGQEAFRYNSYLESIYVNPATESITGATSFASAFVTVGMSAFLGCSKLANIDRLLTFMSYVAYDAFAETGITSLSASGYMNFGNISQIYESAFMGCLSLSNAWFSGCEIVSTRAFADCSILANISFPKCRVIGIGAFRYCSSLSYVYFPACKGIGANAFLDCRTLSYIDLPACSYIDYKAFANCYNLVSVYLRASSVVSINSQYSSSYYGSPFSSTPIEGYSDVAGQYGIVYVPSSLYADYISAFYWSTISSRIMSL